MAQRFCQGFWSWRAVWCGGFLKSHDLIAAEAAVPLDSYSARHTDEYI